MTVGIVQRPAAPQAWLTDVLGRIAEHKTNHLDELLPRNCAQRRCACR
ncbi:MAG: transposase domain-containing protein [Thalassobaculum sp.]